MTAESKAPADTRILVINDDKGALKFLQLVLGHAGYQSAVAVDGASGLKILADQHFDLLILDDLLPDIDGYDILRRIRAEPRWDAMPVILHSARDKIDEISAEHGFDGWIPFLILQGDLKARVAEVLARGRGPFTPNQNSRV